MFRSTVYCCTAAGGDDTDFENMVKLYKNSDLGEEKDRLTRSGMSSFENKELLKKALDFAISENVRSQDTCHFIAGISRNKYGRDLAWEFFKENYDLFKNRYKSGFLIHHLVKSVSERFVDEEKAAMIEKYFEENSWPGTERDVSQAVETIRLNAAWLSRDGASIKKFFETL